MREIKIKHIVYIIIIFFDLMGFVWIKEKVTLLGIASVFCTLLSVVLILVWIMDNWNENI